MYRTESDKTCDQTGFGWFVMYGMYRMLQACLELVDRKGGFLSLLDDSQRFEAKEANQKFLSSFKQSFAPPGGSGGGGATYVGAGSDGYSHGCVSLPSLGWNTKRMIQCHAILNEYFFVVECSTIDRGNTTSVTLLVCSVPTASFCSRRRRWFKLGSCFLIGSPARCARSDPYLPGTSTCLICGTGFACPNFIWFEHIHTSTTLLVRRPNKIEYSWDAYGPDGSVPRLRAVLPEPLSDAFYGYVGMWYLSQCGNSLVSV